MRQYRYPASDDTIEALRALRGAWSSYRIEPRALTVTLADGGVVRVTVERGDVEAAFEAFRLQAVRTAADDATAAPLAASPASPAPDFAIGRNDLVLCTGATWVEGAPVAGASADAVVQFSGSPRQLSPSAVAVCLTTDAFVVASPLGTGFLVRTGVQPYSLLVTDDAGAIARFLGERGYGAEPPVS